MKKIADPDFNLRNKVCDIYHQSSHCLRKLRNHANHHQCDHANHQYDREKQADRSCQFSRCLIFFSKKLIGTLITNTIAPPSINGNIICPIVFSTSSTTSNFHRATTRSAVNTISSRIFLIDKLLKSNIFLLLLPYMYSLNFSG